LCNDADGDDQDAVDASDEEEQKEASSRNIKRAKTISLENIINEPRRAGSKVGFISSTAPSSLPSI
jgi:hypothetical protein